MKAFLRIYWRELLRALVLFLPLMTFSLFGLAWLFERGYLFHALIAMTLTGFLLMLPTWLPRRKGASETLPPRSPDAAWSPGEEVAWQRVQDIAAEAQRKPPTTTEDLKQLSLLVVDSVARELHVESKSPWANFTFPELLLALETTAQNLRNTTLSRVPGAESVTLSHLLALHAAYRNLQPGAAVLWNVFRGYRMLINPLQAAVQEISSHTQGSAIAATREFLTGGMTRLLVEELGRSTINLYGGRYRLTTSEALTTTINKTPEPESPIAIRILLAGQINAGKSSLTNALLGAVQAPVSEVPTPEGVRQFRTTPGSPVDLVIVDTPGLGDSEKEIDELLAQVEQADLIVWVARATQAGRKIDWEALERIRQHMRDHPSRRPSPMILTMTHIDKLPPSREWCPPYNIATPETPKEKIIADSLDQVSKTLGLQHAPIVPIALPEGNAAYNLDSLWAAIAANLSDAQLTALDRALKQKNAFSLATTFSQCQEGGRFLLGKLWKYSTAISSENGDNHRTEAE